MRRALWAALALLLVAAPASAQTFREGDTYVSPGRGTAVGGHTGTSYIMQKYDPNGAAYTKDLYPAQVQSVLVTLASVYQVGAAGTPIQIGNSFDAMAYGNLVLHIWRGSGPADTTGGIGLHLYVSYDGATFRPLMRESSWDGGEEEPYICNMDGRTMSIEIPASAYKGRILALWADEIGSHTFDDLTVVADGRWR